MQKVYTMKVLSLKLEEKIFEETEQLVKETHTSRNRYINEAIDYYNKLRKRELLAQQFQKESLLCRDESMRVLKEFESIEGELNG
jgi:metal-responsive CopG/Arc/MetJ family transcriptional regulator